MEIGAPPARPGGLRVISGGWDEQAIMRTGSPIDLPRSDGMRSPFVVAGVAWAGDRRVQRVEVSSDDGASWQPAQLEAELAPLAWRRWQTTLDLPPGVHALKVRAVDGRGAMQDEAWRPPHPSGASGYHRVVVRAV